MSFAALRNISRRVPIARSGLTSRLVGTPAVKSQTNFLARRWYSEENSNNNKKPEESKDKKQPESLLTEDVLSKAGMDIPENNGKKQEESSSASNESTSASEEDHSGATEEQKERWKGTAKKSSDKSSSDLKWEQRSNLFYVGLLGMAVGGSLYLARDLEDEEKKKHPDVNNGLSPVDGFERVKVRVKDFFNYFNEPVFDELLPDPLPEPYGRPLTLVLGLDDLLIHSEWTREHGWRTAKRPGLDYFLGYLAQYYEVVIFSSNYMAYSEKTVAALDPYRASISHALFREATRYQDGKVIKDISHLNRDQSKVIMVDADPNAYSLQPDNAVAMPAWKGDAKDKDLVRLIPFLEWVATQPVKDVRPILKSFQGTNVPEEYAKREAIARQQWEEDWKKKHSQQDKDWASSILGLPQQTPPTPMMPQDYIRQEGQKGYEAFQKYIQEHGEKILKEEKEREQEILNEQKFTLNKLVTEGMPKPEEIAEIQQRKEMEKQQQDQQQK